jgi:hypothetical protein
MVVRMFALVSFSLEAFCFVLPLDEVLYPGILSGLRRLRTLRGQGFASEGGGVAGSARLKEVVGTREV